MASKIKVDTLETADGTGSIALSNQLSGMTVASLPPEATAAASLTGALPALDGSALTNMAAGGKVLQVVNISYSSASGIASAGALHELSTLFRLSITPKSSTSTLYFEMSAAFCSVNTSHLHWGHFYDVTNSSTPSQPNAVGSRKRVHWAMRVDPYDANDFHMMQMQTKVSSSSTTARTYTVYHGTEGATDQFIHSTLETNGFASPFFFKITEVEA